MTPKIQPKVNNLVEQAGNKISIPTVNSTGPSNIYGCLNNKLISKYFIFQRY